MANSTKPGATITVRRTIVYAGDPAWVRRVLDHSFCTPGKSYHCGAGNSIMLEHERMDVNEVECQDVVEVPHGA